ncbi:hypothetical protein F4804DRAFT_352950 [Jackrogersella minutella]|nr:hypothetical protein F4804DRAFT_352950 [Jackrogersella minutella]
MSTNDPSRGASPGASPGSSSSASSSTENTTATNRTPTYANATATRNSNGYGQYLLPPTTRSRTNTNLSRRREARESPSEPTRRTPQYTRMSSQSGMSNQQSGRGLESSRQARGAARLNPNANTPAGIVDRNASPLSRHPVTTSRSWVRPTLADLGIATNNTSAVIPPGFGFAPQPAQTYGAYGDSHESTIYNGPPTGTASGTNTDPSGGGSNPSNNSASPPTRSSNGARTSTHTAPLNTNEGPDVQQTLRPARNPGPDHRWPSDNEGALPRRPEGPTTPPAGPAGAHRRRNYGDLLHPGAAAAPPLARGLPLRFRRVGRHVRAVARQAVARARTPTPRLAPIEEVLDPRAAVPRIVLTTPSDDEEEEGGEEGEGGGEGEEGGRGGKTAGRGRGAGRK